MQPSMVSPSPRRDGKKKAKFGEMVNHDDDERTSAIVLEEEKQEQERKQEQGQKQEQLQEREQEVEREQEQDQQVETEKDDNEDDNEDDDDVEKHAPPQTMQELEESGILDDDAGTIVDVDDDVGEEGEGEEEGRRGQDEEEDEEDDDEEEEDDDDDGEEHMNRMIEKPNEMSGRLKSIEATDFMCHRRMTVKLGSRINFITGANGSGKSAIIAALQMCLGMGARQTHRGTNLSSLIRHGATGNAKVAVTLHNTGELAYQREHFGDFITIERVLTPAGSSSYTLKTASGKVHSRRKHAVNDVIEHFHLHVGNPCCILDQESSKGFIKGNESDKYKFFLKASLLEKMQNEYIEERSVRNNARAELKRKIKDMNNLRDDWDNAVNKLEEMKQMGKYELRKKALSEEYMWRGALDAEHEQILAKANVEKHEKKLETANLKLQGAEDSCATLQSENETVLENSKATMEEYDDARNKSEHARQALQEASDGLNEYKLKIDRSRSQIAEYTKGIGNANSSIRDTRAEQMRSNPKDEKERILGQLNDCNQELQGLRKTDSEGRTVEEVNNAKMEELYEDQYKIEDQRKGCEEQTRACKQKIKRCTNEIAQVSAQQKDATARFGRWVPKLLNLIEKEARLFHEKPLHIGLHVDLLDERCWSPIEQSLRMVLCSFAVTDSHDLAQLKTLAHKAGAGRELKVIVSRFIGRRHNITHPDDRNLKTIESCLSISNDNVFNVLVDQAMIEGTVIFQTSREASSTLFKPAGNGTVAMPRNIVQGVDLLNNQYTVARGSEMIQNYSDGKKNTKSKYFAADASARIPECEQALAQARHELIVYVKEAEQFANEMHKVTQSMSEIKETQKMLTQRTRQIDSEIVRLTQAQDRLQLDDGLDSKIRGMEEYKVSLEEKVNLEKKAMEDTIVAQQKHQQVIAPLQQEAALADARTHELERKVNEHHTRINEWQTEYQRAMAEKEQAVQRVTKREEKVGDEREKYEKKAAKATELRDAALEFSGNVEVTPSSTTNEIRLELDGIDKRIEKERRRLREVSTLAPAVLLQQAKTNVERAKNQLETTETQISVVKRRLRRLRQSHRSRQKLWRTFQRRMQRRTNTRFAYHMSRRQHGGSLVFDDKNQELTIKWQKCMSQTQGETQMDAGTEITDTKALSGGEKSYTTVALLLSMGVIVESPFRVMDEFDVFMDEVNRDEVMKQLVDAAKDDGRQYLLITPHNIGNVEISNDIRTFKMRPPAKDFGRSQQTTLNFEIN